MTQLKRETQQLLRSALEQYTELSDGEEGDAEQQKQQQESSCELSPDGIKPLLVRFWL